jgi:hypothetical protein
MFHAAVAVVADKARLSTQSGMLYRWCVPTWRQPLQARDIDRFLNVATDRNRFGEVAIDSEPVRRPREVPDASDFEPDTNYAERAIPESAPSEKAEAQVHV